METLPKSAIELGGTQIPLLEASQVQVRDILVGVWMKNAWEVLEVNKTRLIVGKLPRPNVVNHDCNFDTNVCTICGRKKTLMKHILPKDEGSKIARVHIIRPSGPVLDADPYGLYIGRTPGQNFTDFYSNGLQWTIKPTAIPLLHKIWTLPDEMRALMPISLTEMENLLD